MSLKELGFTPKYENIRLVKGFAKSQTGRVTTVLKERYIVATSNGELQVELVDDFHNSIISNSDFPYVGDWVGLKVYSPQWALIHSVFPRLNLLTKKALERAGNVQPIAANIDYVFLVQEVENDFNINHLERYISDCRSGNISPIIVLRKTDQITEQDLKGIVDDVKIRFPNIPVIDISNASDGVEKIKSIIEKGKTYCFFGSVGMGKSSLINLLCGENQVGDSNNLTISTNNGVNITNHRELVVLKGGGLLIDNPGIRAYGIVASELDVKQSFNQINELSKKCTTTKCSHLHEKGCAVLKAVEVNELDLDLYENYIKQKKEIEDFELDQVERKNKDNALGKKVKKP